MYKAQYNAGIFYELEMLINYVEDIPTLELLDELIREFKGPGLSLKQLRQVINLIDLYLPSYLECDSQGCYFTQEINNIPALTYFDALVEHPISSNNIKQLVGV